MSMHKFPWGRTFLIGFGFLGISIIWPIFNQYVPLFLQHGNPEFVAQLAEEGRTLPDLPGGGLGLAPALAMFIMTWDNLINIFVQPWVGAKSDRTWNRFGRRKSWILIGAPIAILGFVLLPVAQSILAIMVFILITNFGMAIFRSPTISWLGDLFIPTDRSKANGVINLMGGVGGLIAYFGGGILFKSFGREAPFIGGAVAMVVALTVCLLLVKEPRNLEIEHHEKTSTWQNLKGLIADQDKSGLFIERNFNLIKRYWTWELVWLVYSTADCMAVSFIGLGMQKISGSEGLNTSYLVLYLLVGTLVWRFLSVIFYWITDLIAIERWEGTIEYTLMAPIQRITHMTGQTIFSVIYSLVFTGVILGVTAIVFKIDLSSANLFGGIVLLLAGSFSFIGIGIMASVLPLLFPERGSQMTHVFIALLLLVSGVYYPVDVLPAALRSLSAYSPATYVLEGVREALLEGVRLGALWHYVWPTLIMGAILIPAGLLVFKQAERYAKKTGKLHRNG